MILESNSSSQELHVWGFELMAYRYASYESIVLASVTTTLLISACSSIKFVNIYAFKIIIKFSFRP